MAATLGSGFSPDSPMCLPWEIWRDNFMQDAPAELARQMWRRLSPGSPGPNQVNLDRLDLKQFYALSQPRSVICSCQDRSLPQGSFHPDMSSRLGEYRLIEIEGSHQVLFTRPAELADVIIGAIEERAEG